MNSTSPPLPELVQTASAAAEQAGFTLSVSAEVGQLLAVLAASVRPAGSILELGTGAGVGLAWITSGLNAREDVRVVSVETDRGLAELAAALPFSPQVNVEVADALEVLRWPGGWSLIFADAQGGKWDGLDHTIEALEQGGVLLVDDMAPAEFVDDHHRNKTEQVREQLLRDGRLNAVELQWSTGVILCSRR